MQFEMKAARVPAGAHKAKLISVEPFSENATQFGEGVKFTFRVVEGEHEGSETSRITGCKLTPKSALAKLLTKLKGGAIEVGESVDPSAYIGSECTVVVQETESGSTRVETIL